MFEHAAELEAKYPGKWIYLKRNGEVTAVGNTPHEADGIS
jgi:hypothetical protein